MGKRNFTADNYVRRKSMSVLLKSLIAVVQERNQPVDITLGFPDILLQFCLWNEVNEFFSYVLLLPCEWNA